jgi:gliding motility-associated-like protein
MAYETFTIIENIVPIDYNLSSSIINCSDQGQVELNTFGENVDATWLGPANFTSNLTSFQTTESGQYLVSFIDAAGCMYEDSITVDIDTIAPSFGLMFTQEDCQFESVSLTISDWNNSWNIEWLQNGSAINSSNQNIDLNSEGLYEAVVTDPTNGCRSSQSFEYIPIEPLIFEYFLEHALCSGEDGLLVLESITGGIAPYTVLLTGQNLSQSITDSIWLESGDYQIEISDAASCSLIEFFTIEEPTLLSFPEQLTINWQNQTALNVEELLNIDADDFQSIEWNPASLVSCSDCFLTEFIGEESSYLTILLTDQFGCSYSSALQIEVPIRYWCELPNVFSPNKRDGLNDSFFPFTSNNIELVNELIIYDRWGNLVFENSNFSPNDSAQGWNGHHKGSKSASGVYTYVITVTLPDGQVSLKAGDVSLIE